MKKIILLLTVIFTLSSFSTIQNSTQQADSARDCVNRALAATEAIADCFGEDIRGENQNEYLEIYIKLYEGCMA